MLGILKIQKLENREFSFTYCEVVQSSEVSGEDGGEIVIEEQDDIKAFGEITLKVGQVRLV